MQTSEVAQPAPTAYHFGQPESARFDRAVGYNLTAAHGWEFLLDNHLEQERDRQAAVNHAVVLGEN